MVLCLVIIFTFIARVVATSRPSVLAPEGLVILSHFRKLNERKLFVLPSRTFTCSCVDGILVPNAYRSQHLDLLTSSLQLIRRSRSKTRICFTKHPHSLRIPVSSAEAPRCSGLSATADSETGKQMTSWNYHLSPFAIDDLFENPHSAVPT